MGLMERIRMNMAAMPKVEPVVESEVWRLAEDWHVTINGLCFTVPAGFMTDGASIPRFLWRLCGHPMTTKRFPVALLHDWLYAEGERLTRAEADEIYHDSLCDLGFSKWKAWLEYKAIRIFGGSHWEGDRDS